MLCFQALCYDWTLKGSHGDTHGKSSCLHRSAERVMQSQPIQQLLHVVAQHLNAQQVLSAKRKSKLHAGTTAPDHHDIHSVHKLCLVFCPFVLVVSVQFNLCCSRKNSQLDTFHRISFIICIINGTYSE